MQSLARHSVRGLGRYCGLAATQSQARLIHLAPPAAAPAGKDAEAKAKTVGKSVLAKRLSETHKELSNKLAAEIIDTLLDDIMLTVAEGETVTIPGFGSFKKRHRAARKGRNPSTGADMDIPAKDSPAFSAGSVFKGVVQTGNWEAYDEMVAKQKAEKAAKGKK
jgi:nucleoid DNA-binding protein